MKIAIVGLGKMGGQIARKLKEDNFEVIAHARTKSSVDEVAKLGMIPAYTKEEVIKSFGGERAIIWLMLPAESMEEELDLWLKLVPSESILIDGGNSDFRLTQKRAEKVKVSGSILFDVGTSGGVWGYQNGFSMMVGGDKESFKIIEPILKTLAKPEGAYYLLGE
ncbi:MAG: NAD(P)-binding domain-containing protein, partial [Minisyncoccia bacterium]